MAGGYDALAPVYDRLNESVDYGKWCDFIEKIFDRYADKKPELVLDLGCGTGSMTLELAERGYDMTAIDISEDMLAVAEQRARPLGKNILFVLGNMASFELYGTVDAVVCTLDGINHLTDREDLLSCFSLVNNYLNPNGLFVFDLNTPYKFKTEYADRDYILENDGAVCCWSNKLSKKGDKVEFLLSVFEDNGDGTWKRTDGYECERAYGLKSIKNALEDCGLEILNVSSDYDFSEPVPETKRWYVTARKK